MMMLFATRPVLAHGKPFAVVRQEIRNSQQPSAVRAFFMVILQVAGDEQRCLRRW